MYGPVILLLLGLSILALFAAGPALERLAFVAFAVITAIVFSLIVRKTLKPIALPQSSNVKKLVADSLFFGIFMTAFSIIERERVSIPYFVFVTIFSGLLYGPFVLFQPTRTTLGLSAFRFTKRKGN